MHLSLFVASFVYEPTIKEFYCEALNEDAYDSHRVLAAAPDPNAAVPELHVNFLLLLRYSHLAALLCALAQKACRVVGMLAIG